MGVEGEGEERGGGWLSRRRLFLLLVVVVVVVGLLVLVVIPYLQELLKFESLELKSYWWTQNSQGNITLTTLRLYNNGTKTLKITDVYINQTHVNSTNCGTNSRALPSEFWAWMYVAPDGMVFEEGANYNLTVATEAGNHFSYQVKVEDHGNLGPEKFNIKNADFGDLRYYGGPLYVYLAVENHQAIPVVVVERWVNDTSFGTKRFWIRPGTAGPESLAILFKFNWVEGAAYNFTLKTAAGNIYTYTSTAEE